MQTLFDVFGGSRVALESLLDRRRQHAAAAGQVFDHHREPQRRDQKRHLVQRVGAHQRTRPLRLADALQQQARMARCQLLQKGQHAGFAGRGVEQDLGDQRAMAREVRQQLAQHRLQTRERRTVAVVFQLHALEQGRVPGFDQRAGELVAAAEVVHEAARVDRGAQAHGAHRETADAGFLRDQQTVVEQVLAGIGAGAWLHVPIFYTLV